MNKSAVYAGAFIGSVIGGFIPSLLWGAGQLSFWAVVFGTIGGVAGIVGVYQLYRRFG